MSRQRNVLISVPNNNPRHVVYLPTIWANLKSYCSKSDLVRETFRWLDPIILKGRPEELLTPYGEASIDVLGLSCYSWNAQTNFDLARVVRAKYPHCLVVAGGPHLDYKRTDFFDVHPYVDAIVLKDGEIPFNMALEQVAKGDVDLEQIPGLILPSHNGAAFRATGPPQVPKFFDHSPWLENAEFFESLMADLRRERPHRPIGIPWEVDRGCPFNCTFCDWGSNTNSPVRSFELERVHNEALWIAKNKIHVSFLTIANFGLKPRDEEILDYLIEGKRTYGFPRVFIWNNAKSEVKRVVSMSTKAFSEGLIDYHILSVQSLDEDVLTTMGRPYVDKEVLADVVKDVRAREIPCVAQLIFGAPKDNLERFIGSMTGLMEMDVHEEYVAYPFDVLPNAPAASPEFQEKWGVRTVTRRGSVNQLDPEMSRYDYSTIIVTTNSYDEAEFIRMYVHGRLIIALHNSGLTQFLARYLRQVYGISFHTFYTTLIERLFSAPSAPWHSLYRHCHGHITRFVQEDNPELTESLAVEELPGFDYLFLVEEYCLIKLMLGIDRFYGNVREALQDVFGHYDELDSLLTFQRGSMIDPSYNRDEGRVLQLEHDWPRFFATLGSPGNELAERPEPSSVELAIHRTHAGSQFQYSLDWFDGTDADEALQGWVKTVIGKTYQRVQRSFFHAMPLLEQGEPRTSWELPAKGARLEPMASRLASP